MAVFLIAAVIAAISLGGAFYAYRIAFHSPKKGRDGIPSTSGNLYDPYRQEMKRLFEQLKNRPFEFVTVRSRDGLTLSGRYYHVKDGAPLDIGFHGYRSSCMTDLSGGSEISLQLEHNLLLIDQRAHGRSEGRVITFGILERQDLLCWVDYACKRFGEDIPIFLYGVSMGGATVLMAPQEQLPRNVKGIIADCPYANAMEIILHVAKKKPIPLWLTKPFVILGAWIFGQFDIRQTDARRELPKANIPVLIIHGEADGFVPAYMSDVVSCNPELIQRHIFPGADHGISCLVDKDRYYAAVKAFITDALKNP